VIYERVDILGMTAFGSGGLLEFQATAFHLDVLTSHFVRAGLIHHLGFALCFSDNLCFLATLSFSFFAFPVIRLPLYYEVFILNFEFFFLVVW
jgi:hypothetical protein